MVAQDMGTQVNGNASNGTSLTHTETHVQDPDPNPNLLGRQGSLYSLTLDEVQNQLGDAGKPLGSMNLDELLKSVLLAEGNNTSQGVEDPDFGSNHQQSASVSSLNRQSSVTLSRDLSKKTVDELWQDIQHEEKRSSLDRNTTLGKMTLEDFLAKAGVMAEPPPVKRNVTETTGRHNPISICQPQPQTSQWNMNYPASSIVTQQKPPTLMPVYVPVQSMVPCGNYPVVDVAYTENQITMALSPVIGGALSDTQTPRRKRMAPEDIAEKSVERRQKRMIKNRESAARSRARKQAYTNELENKISRLEEENERLKRRQEWEKVLPTLPPPPQPKHQLRRTSSASF